MSDILKRGQKVKFLGASGGMCDKNIKEGMEGVVISVIAKGQDVGEMPENPAYKVFWGLRLPSVVHWREELEPMPMSVVPVAVVEASPMGYETTSASYEDRKYIEMPSDEQLKGYEQELLADKDRVEEFGSGPVWFLLTSYVVDEKTSVGFPVGEGEQGEWEVCPGFGYGCGVGSVNFNDWDSCRCQECRGLLTTKGGDKKPVTCLTVNAFKGKDSGFSAFAVTKFYCVECIDEKGITTLVKDFVANVKERHDFTPPNVTVLPVGDEDPEQMKKEIDDWVRLSGGGLSSSYLSPV